eukprot:361550-Chlamydomonas_euryale.AAC.2
MEVGRERERRGWRGDSDRATVWRCGWACVWDLWMGGEVWGHVSTHLYVLQVWGVECTGPGQRCWFWPGMGM